MSIDKKRKIIITFSLAACGIIIAAGLIATNWKKDSEVKTFTAFFSSNGNDLDLNNDIMKLIAEKTGARCVESWSNSVDDQAYINDLIIEGKYPDFITGSGDLYEAGALIPLDDYINQYPNLAGYLSESDWDSLRQDDGHIYWIPQFGIVKNMSCEATHEGEAFWIQTRVLKWAGYPEITTLDEYFDLIERYAAANPYMEDGVTEVIPYTILCDDWRIFCLENPPQFLDGYPNDGCCIVDPDTMEVIDYNTTPTAKKYFQKLNEEYKKGIVDPESFTSTYDEYLQKLSTGAVLGMVDQRWDFSYGILRAYSEKNLAKQGCEYVPLPITISKDIKNKYHIDRASEFDISTGLAITVSCKDVDGALQFINDLLDEDIMRLRYWGVEGEDYMVAEDGEFYIAESQGKRTSDTELMVNHFCNYSFFPRFEGYMDDGINSYQPEFQPSVVRESFSDQVTECLDAYGAENMVDLLGYNDKPGEWFPMYSYSARLTYSTEVGAVYNDLQEIQHRYLPQVVMAEDFETAWADYLEAYNQCQPEIFFDALQQEVDRRVSK